MLFSVCEEENEMLFDNIKPEQFKNTIKSRRNTLNVSMTEPRFLQMHNNNKFEDQNDFYDCSKCGKKTINKETKDCINQDC